MNKNELLWPFRKMVEEKVSATFSPREVQMVIDAVSGMVEKKKVVKLVNEICLKCEKYKTAHEGACDGCPSDHVKWNTEKWGEDE